LKLKKYIQYWSIPSLLFIVACFQLYQAEFEHKTRWKGGGFGMYSTIYPFIDEIWVNDKFITYEGLPKKDSLKIKLLTYKVKVHPTKHHIKNLLDALELDEDSVKVQIFKPEFDLEKSIYTKTLRYETTFRQD
jgi:hypothetical protein